MKNSRFVALLVFLTAIGLLVSGLIVSANSGDKPGHQSPQEIQQTLNKISTWVLEKAAADEDVEFLVLIKDQADLSGAESLPTKEEKGRYVFELLRAKAELTQGPLIEWLKERRIEYRPFYIVNVIWVKGTRDLALEIAARADVARIEGNPVLQGIKPINIDEKESIDLTALTAGIEPGVSFIRAPEVWALGFTGQGVVIGGQDTGVRWDHSALVGQYRGSAVASINGGVDHDYNWHDSVHSGGGDCGADSSTPCDDDNHGTHTLGTAVGADGGANQVGVAPGAKFIACRNMDRGKGTPATYLECFQFFLAPYPVKGTPQQGDPSKAPDITTNSWLCPPSEGCSPDTLRAAVEAHRAAGIMTIVAAGNAGAACSTVVDPPAIYDASYSVGAINAATGAIASFSSRGPVIIDGSNRIKPDIAAPGVSVRSAIRSGGYAFLNGTSMATPHVAGAVALLWSAYPELRGQIVTTENILNQSAVRVEVTDCSSNGFPNNVFGFGRLDVKAAVDLAATKLSPSEQTFGIRGGGGQIEVTALPGVLWRAISNDPWITINDGKTGTGSGVVSFTVNANAGADSRTGSLTIAGRTVKITQPGTASLYAVSGRITTADGSGIGKVTLHFTSMAGIGEAPNDVLTNDDGSWAQSGFESETTYRVTASRSRLSFTPPSLDFNAPSTALNFTGVGRRIALGTLFQ